MSEDVSHTTIVLTIIDRVEISDITKGTVDVGLWCLAGEYIDIPVGGAGDIDVMTLNGLRGKSQSFRLRGGSDCYLSPAAA